MKTICLIVISIFFVSLFSSCQLEHLGEIDLPANLEQNSTEPIIDDPEKKDVKPTQSIVAVEKSSIEKKNTRGKDKNIESVLYPLDEKCAKGNDKSNLRTDRDIIFNIKSGPFASENPGINCDEVTSITETQEELSETNNLILEDLVLGTIPEFFFQD